MDMDASMCSKRNIHNRSEKDINDIIANWEPSPKHYLRLDVCSLLQSVAITEVEMEDSAADKERDETKDETDTKDTNADKEQGGDETEKDGDKDGDEELENSTTYTSKWERMEPSGDKLNRLDGLGRMQRSSHSDSKPRSLEDWLQLSDEYVQRAATPGKKWVRWADLEEKREQEKMRAIGFVVGQTDWARMTDPTFGEGALTQSTFRRL